MAQYIEIEVPDSFDDEQDTTFEAVGRAVAIYPASPVSQAKLLAALKESELVLRTLIAGTDGRLDVPHRSWNSLSHEKLQHLRATAGRLRVLIARAERTALVEEQPTCAVSMRPERNKVTRAWRAITHCAARRWRRISGRSAAR
jgi:hypothetical protein